MSPNTHKAMHAVKMLWLGLGRVPDLTQSSIVTATALSAVWVALLLVFYNVPGIDLGMAGLFFHAQDCRNSISHAVCGSFPISHNRLVQTVRKLLFYLPHVTGVVVLVTLIVKIIESKDKRVSEFPSLKKRNSEWITKLSLSLLTALIGPFFIVNVILKAWSGRPRPIETTLFGGDLSFAPAGSFSGACDGNCSFVSGEAAGAGIIICVVPFLPPVWRRRLGPPLVVASISTALLRVAFGGHYFSDAVLGWLLSPVVFAWVFAIYHLRTRPQTC